MQTQLPHRILKHTLCTSLTPITYGHPQTGFERLSYFFLGWNIAWVLPLGKAHGKENFLFRNSCDPFSSYAKESSICSSWWSICKVLQCLWSEAGGKDEKIEENWGLSHLLYIYLSCFFSSFFLCCCCFFNDPCISIYTNTRFRFLILLLLPLPIPLLHYRSGVLKVCRRRDRLIKLTSFSWAPWAVHRRLDAGTRRALGCALTATSGFLTAVMGHKVKFSGVCSLQPTLRAFLLHTCMVIIALGCLACSATFPSALPARRSGSPLSSWGRWGCATLSEWPWAPPIAGSATGAIPFMSWQMCPHPKVCSIPTPPSQMCCMQTSWRG